MATTLEQLLAHLAALQARRAELDRDIDAFERVVRNLQAGPEFANHPLEAADEVAGSGMPEQEPTSAALRPDITPPHTPPGRRQRKAGRMAGMRGLFTAQPDRTWDAATLAAELGEEPDEATLRSYYGALSRMARAGEIERADRGTYRLARPTHDSAPAATGAESTAAI